MAEDFMRTFIAKFGDSSEWSWEDELWVVRGTWQDLYDALTDAHAWVARKAPTEGEGNPGPALPPGAPITIVVGYPPHRPTALEESSTLLAEAKTLSNVVTFSVAPEPAEHEWLFEDPGRLTQNRLTVTLLPQRGIAYAHFPMPIDLADHPGILTAIARDPQRLVEALRASGAVWRVTTGERYPTTLEAPPADLTFADIDAPTLGHLRMLLQTGCQAPEQPEGTALPCIPACCTAVLTIVDNPATGTTALAMDTFLYTCYYVCPV